MPRLVLACLCCLCAAAAGAEEIASPPDRMEKGTFRFTPKGDPKEVPECYRLEARPFDYELTLERELPASEVNVYHLRFPSPIKSPHPENNTVHAEYYRPAGKGPFPAAIVLDITGGDQALSRNLATYLAQNRIAGLFVQMAYYGPRRPAGSKVRLLMPDIDHTLGAVRQTVLDLRAASAWLESRPELDAKRLGIVGTSLGSFMAALAAEMEPRLGRAVVLLGGGGFVDGYWDHPKAVPYRKVYEALGGTKEQLQKRIAQADPITCAANLKARKLLIIAGKRDDIVPPKMAEALWNASGRQQIVWYDCTHYGAVLYLPAGFDHVVKHFRAP
jgi:dienelactone hydrolase